VRVGEVEIVMSTRRRDDLELSASEDPTLVVGLGARVGSRTSREFLGEVNQVVARADYGPPWPSCLNGSCPRESAGAARRCSRAACSSHVVLEEVLEDEKFWASTCFCARSIARVNMPC